MPKSAAAQPGYKASPLRITRELDFGEVRWGAVQEQLMHRHALTAESAEMSVQDFRRRFVRPLNLYWFSNRSLQSRDNRLLSCLCRCHGADEVILLRSKNIAVGALELEYRHRVLFRPTHKEGEDQKPSGDCIPEVTISLFGRRLRLCRSSQIILLDLFLSVLAVVSYVCLFGFLAYGTAVFIVFLREPVVVAGEATRHASLGLALLCYLVGLTALSRRVISQMLRRIKGRVPSATDGLR
jgi:hypothetical protein